MDSIKFKGKTMKSILLFIMLMSANPAYAECLPFDTLTTNITSKYSNTTGYFDDKNVVRTIVYEHKTHNLYLGFDNKGCLIAWKRVIIEK